MNVKVTAHEIESGNWNVYIRLQGVSGRNCLIGWYGPNSPKQEFTIANVFIEEGLRGRGYGRLLVETFEHFARSRGAGVVYTFLTKEKAIPTWEHLGYVQQSGVQRWWKRVDTLGPPNKEILAGLEHANVKTTGQLEEEFQEEERAAEKAFRLHQEQTTCDKLSAIRNLAPEEATELILGHLNSDDLPPETNVVICVIRCDGRWSRDMSLEMYPEWYKTASPHYYAEAVFSENGSIVKLYAGRDE